MMIVWTAQLGSKPVQRHAGCDVEMGCYRGYVQMETCIDVIMEVDGCVFHCTYSKCTYCMVPYVPCWARLLSISALGAPMSHDDVLGCKWCW
eukprot:3540234-Ditylum_brightwellii.AAC.1